MEKEIKFAKNTLIVGIGKVTTQIISFCLLPLYTNMLSQEQYGYVDLFQTYASILMVIVYVQLDQALFRFLIDSREDTYEKEGIISSVLCLSFFIDIIFVIIGVLLIGTTEYYNVFFITASLHTMENLLQLSRGIGDNVTYTIANFINSVLLIGFNIILLVVFGLKTEGMVLSLVISSICASIYVLIRLRVSRFIKFNCISRPLLKKLLIYSIPLVPNAISWWIIGASDRLIVSSIIDVAAVGIITVAQKFSTAIFNIFCVINITWNEYVSVNITDKENTNFSDMMTAILTTFASICLGCITIMPMVFSVFINSQYADAYNYIWIYISAVFFNIGNNLLNAFYVGLKKTKDVAKTSVVSAVINIAVNLALIKWLGIYAAAVSTLFAFSIVFLWRSVDLKKYIKLTWNSSKILQLVVLWFVTIVVYLYRKSKELCLLNTLLIIAFWVLYNRKMIIKVCEFLKRRVGK